MFNVFIQSSRWNMTESTAIPWAVMGPFFSFFFCFALNLFKKFNVYLVPVITPSTLDYSRNLWSYSGLYFKGDGLKGPSSEILVQLSSGSCASARVNELPSEAQSEGTWEVYCNGTGGSVVRLNPFQSFLLDFDFVFFSQTLDLLRQQQL